MPSTHHDHLTLSDARQAIAIIGDLSMGLPMDHSLRVPRLSVLLAREMGWEATTWAQVRQPLDLRVLGTP